MISYFMQRVLGMPQHDLAGRVIAGRRRNVQTAVLRSSSSSFLICRLTAEDATCSSSDALRIDP